MKLIDLSVELNAQTPIYPGDPPIKIEPAGLIENDGYNDHLISVGTHAGTHIDAPFHMLADGKTLDQIPLEQFMGRGRYIKINNQVFDLEIVKAADIQNGDIVLFDTGMGELYHEQEYFDSYPEIPEEIANYLVEKKVKIVGMDMCSPDHSPYKIHKILLSGNTLIIENLTNLSQLAGIEFTVRAFPLKLAIDGSPIRVIAEVL